MNNPPYSMDTAKESHPLPPFLPPHGRLLLMGSFPPPRARWCMEWFYPNFQNDMWRIWGLIAEGNKEYFVVPGEKRFDEKRVVDFCTRMGIGLCDTGEEAVRLKGNASDAHLQVVKVRDLTSLLKQMPLCSDVGLTGEKAVQTLGRVFDFKHIDLGGYVEREVMPGRHVRIWRMPSSSRAYPRSIEWKADYYRKLWEAASAPAES